MNAEDKVINVLHFFSASLCKLGNGGGGSCREEDVGCPTECAQMGFFCAVIQRIKLQKPQGRQGLI